MILNSEKLAGCKKEVTMLIDFLHAHFKTNLTVTSGKRSEEENAKAGGVKNSAHLTGEAVDFVVQDVHPFKVAAKIMEVSGKFFIKGIGVNIFLGYTHADIKDRGSKTIATWLYDRNNKQI